MSKHKPEMQNIPLRTATGRKLRDSFYAASGSALLDADYSHLEYRMIARLREERSKTILGAIDKANQDIFTFFIQLDPMVCLDPLNRGWRQKRIRALQLRVNRLIVQNNIPSYRVSVAESRYRKLWITVPVEQYNDGYWENFRGRNHV